MVQNFDIIPPLYLHDFQFDQLFDNIVLQVENVEKSAKRGIKRSTNNDEDNIEDGDNTNDPSVTPQQDNFVKETHQSFEKSRLASLAGEMRSPSQTQP